MKRMCSYATTRALLLDMMRSQDRQVVRLFCPFFFFFFLIICMCQFVASRNNGQPSPAQAMTQTRKRAISIQEIGTCATRLHIPSAA